MSIVIDKANRPVDTSGEVWVLYEALKRYELDWTRVSALPEFVVHAAKRYAVHMIRRGAPVSVAAFFNGTICPLLRCASAQRPADRLTERTFHELRELVAHDKAALQRFRKFYLSSAESRLPGFDRESAYVMYAGPIGAHRAPDPALGRSAPLKKHDLDFIEEQLAAQWDSLSLDGRVALALSLQLCPNASPMALTRGSDLAERIDGPILHVPRHKKRLNHERAQLKPRPIGERLAEDIHELMDTNARLAAEMIWPDGTIGLPPGVALPIFMRREPKPSHAALDCPVREFALHRAGTEVSALIQRTVAVLCEAAGRPIIRMTARVGKRTVLTEAQRQGLPPEVVADIGDHTSIRHIPRYAAEGLEVIEHVQNAIGDRLAQLCGSYTPVAGRLSSDKAELLLGFRESTFGSR